MSASVIVTKFERNVRKDLPLILYKLQSTVSLSEHLAVQSMDILVITNSLRGRY